MPIPKLDASIRTTDNLRQMTKKNINRLIGFGILTFVFGYALGFYLTRYFQLLIPIGTSLTFIGVYYFFKHTNLIEEFSKKPHEDMLTYFWNAIVLKLWTSIFILWMIGMNIFLLAKGFIQTHVN
jgi:hypothetical protein